MTNDLPKKKEPHMATATRESCATQALPRELEEFVDSAIDEMDKSALKNFQKESEKILEASRARAGQRHTRETA